MNLTDPLSADRGLLSVTARLARFRGCPLVVATVLVVASALAGRAAAADQRRDEMDFKPYISSSILSWSTASFDNGPGSFSGDSTARGFAIRVAHDWDAGIVFDADLMRISAGWIGGPLSLKGVAYDGAHGPSPMLSVPPMFQTPHLPGWAGPGGSFKDPRPNTISPLPPPGRLATAWAKYKGLYVHGDRVVLSYSVGGVDVLESPTLASVGGLKAIARNIRVERSDHPLAIMLADGNPEVPQPGQRRKVGIADDGYDPNPGKPKVTGTVTGPHARIGDLHILAEDAPAGAVLEATSDGYVTLRLPKLDRAVTFQVLYLGGGDEAQKAIDERPHATKPPADLVAMTRGGPAQWPDIVETKGELARDESAPYVIDRLTLPTNNPYHARMRIGGFDFFSDNRSAALSTWHGDVWIVTGIDDTLEHLKWRRFAAGLHQPLGLKIVDDVVYTVGHDQITRLNDLNHDGEADFYECFNNDWQLTSAFHAFAFDLHTDPQGNFVFAFGSPVHAGGGGFQRIAAHHGSILKVSKDGGKLSVYATGLRAPNGMCVGPDGQITIGDNEGTWVPKCPLHWVEKGEFLGVMDSAHRALSDDEKPPKPLCWMPKNVDNSGGGQAWVTSDKWGPFQGELLHMSYGTSSLFLVLKEKKAGIMQGGVVKFPLRFTSSAMRARFNKRDGQLYITGLRGWQSNAAREGGFDRVRYTGKPVYMPVGLHVQKNGVRITFTQPLDKQTAADADSYAVSQWNYLWTGGYGSLHVSASDPKQPLPKGAEGEPVEVKSATLAADGKSVFLQIPDIKPVMQMRIQYNIDAADGKPMRGDIYNTIHTTGE